MRKRDWADDLTYGIWCDSDEDDEFPSKAIANALRDARRRAIIQAANKAEKWDTLHLDKDGKEHQSGIGKDIATDILALLMEEPSVSFP